MSAKPHSFSPPGLCFQQRDRTNWHPTLLTTSPTASDSDVVSRLWLLTMSLSTWQVLPLLPARQGAREQHAGVRKQGMLQALLRALPPHPHWRDRRAHVVRRMEHGQREGAIQPTLIPQPTRILGQLSAARTLFPMLSSLHLVTIGNPPTCPPETHFLN